MKVGVLALQGDYAAHTKAIARANHQALFVRTPEELEAVDSLIIPGGESTTLLKLLDDKFIAAIKRLPQQNKPILGTCAGAILLASEVTNPKQNSLGLVNISVERNSYGRQFDSHVGLGSSVFQKDPLEMIFIRAPKICRVSNSIKILATYKNEPVCVQQDLCIAATFHPELSANLALLNYFVRLRLATSAQ